MKNSRTLLTPVLAALLVGTSLAGAQTQNRAAPQGKTQAQSQRPERPERAPLTVKYYSGHPLQGGKVVSTTTLQPQPRGTTGTTGTTNPFANAPAGATHVAIVTPSGTRITTVKEAQARTMANGRGGRDANVSGARGDRNNRGGRSEARPGDRTGDRITSGLRLRGLRDATSVAFYASDPLTGGKPQTTIRLSAEVTQQQQTALSQAAANAKFAVVERPGETLVVDLSATPQRFRAGPR